MTQVALFFRDSVYASYSGIDTFVVFSYVYILVDNKYLCIFINCF